MSHIVQIQTQVRDPAAIAAACQRLGLSQPRFLLITGAVTMFLIGTFGFVPWPSIREAPAVVEYAPHIVVRAASPEFVREVCVQSGERVRKGQLLAVLENQDLNRDLSDLELQILQSEIRAKQFEQKGELAAKQAELAQREGLLVQTAEKRFQVAQLTNCAPRDGRVVRRDLASLVGHYLSEGDEVLSLGDEMCKELRISVAQDDLDAFQGQIGKLVRVDIPRLAAWKSTLIEVIPLATLQPPHAALIASNGGPLAVKNVAYDSDTEQPGQELLATRFTGIVELSPEFSQQVRAGQLGSVSYRPCSESIGAHLYQAFGRWLRVRLKEPVG